MIDPTMKEIQEIIKPIFSEDSHGIDMENLMDQIKVKVLGYGMSCVFDSHVRQEALDELSKIEEQRNVSGSKN